MITYVLRFIQAIIIARWLGPTEMGLYALAFSILTMIELIEKIGANQLFIAQSPNGAAEQEWLFNCWTARVIMAFFATLLVICVAKTSFADDRVGPILISLSIMPPLLALKSARIMLMQKRREFVPLAKFEIGSALFRSVCAVVAVYTFRSTESLVWSNIGAAIALTIATHVAFSQKHRFMLSRSIIRELTSFGGKSAYISALSTAHNNLDNLAVSGSLGQTALGHYSTGYRLAMTPLGFVQSVSTRILTSHYRHASDKGLDLLVIHWRLAFRFLILFNAALMSIVILLTEPAVDLVLGAEWSNVVPVITLSAFTAFFRGATLSISPLMMIRRKLHLDAVMKTVEVTIFVVFIAAGYWLQDLTVFLIGGIVSYAAAFVLRLLWWYRYVYANGLPKPPTEGSTISFSLIMVIASYLAVASALPLFWVAAGLILVSAGPVLKSGRALIEEMDA
ncbi:oligosaccharide flippase family protein [Ferrimonas balearica]|nr:oligosaccharide flippase family protein [Ferrimonas balearica]